MSTQPKTSGADSGFEIVDRYGGVLLQRDDERDVCFIHRRNIGSPLGLPKIAKRFASRADAQAFVTKHKLRNVWAIPAEPQSVAMAREASLAETAPRHIWGQL